MTDPAPAALDDVRNEAGAMVAALHRGTITATGLIQRTLDRIAADNDHLVAFTETYDAEALDAARRLDRRLEAGEALAPLAGIPVAVKDLTPLSGKRTTLGSRAYRDEVGTFDPVYVQRLRAAGAIVVGKTNTPEFAHSGFCSNAVFGTTRNPWDTERTPGGSSGGAGAAVAAGHLPLAEGTDMGGSVRIPAAYCGLVGLKPSLGRIPMDILPSVFDTISHFGPLTPSVEDAWRFLEATRGPAEVDPLSLSEQAIPFDRDAAVDGLKIACSPDLGFYAVDADVARNLERSADALRCQGAKVENIHLDWDHSIQQMNADNWALFLAAFQGHLLANHRDELDPENVAMMDRAANIDAITAKRFEILRTRMWRDLSQVFATFDALLCPTVPCTAPPASGSDLDYGHRDANGYTVTAEMTAPFNFVPHCPAITVPSGLGDDGLPTAAQLVTPRFDEATAFRVARAIERTAPLGGASASP